MNQNGFVVIYRRTFEHELFRGEKPFTRLQAWVWLIGSAAWCPSTVKINNAVVSVDRGQLATTVRELGKAWGWKHGKVERFLRSLRREAMIRTLATGTPSKTPSETPKSLQYTIITICNYSIFQNPSTGHESQPSHPPRQVPSRRRAQQLEFEDEFRPQPLNQKTKKGRGGVKSGEKRGEQGPERTKPRHGARAVAKGLVFIDHGTPEWAVYAEDYKAVRGAEPFPIPYLGGQGRWFKIMGEAAKPLVRAPSTTRDDLESAQRRRRRSTGGSYD